MATGRDVSITIFTASSLNSGEKLLFLGRVKIIYLPGIILTDDCPGSSGHLIQVLETGRKVLGPGRTGDEGTSRVAHQWTVDPNRVRQLATGQAALIAHRGATFVSI